MILNFIYSFYVLIILGFVLVYFFIVYHLIRYSINAALNRIIFPLFIVVSILLLASNVILFFAIDWETMLSGLNIY